MSDGTSTEAEEIQRIVSASVRNMLDAFRLQAIARYPGPQRVATLPSLVRMLLATFLEDVAGRAST